MAGWRRVETLFAISASAAGPGARRRGRHRAPGRYLGDGNQSHGQRPRAGPTAQRLRRAAAGLRAGRLPDRQPPRVRVHPPPPVQDSVFVGIVSGPGAHQGRHQGSFAAEGTPGHEDGPTAPADYAGVDENPTERLRGHEKLKVALQRSEQLLQIQRPRQRPRIRAEPVVAAEPRRWVRTLAAQGIKEIDRRGSGRLPPRRQQREQSLQQLRPVDADTNAKAVGAKGDPSRPPMAVEPCHFWGRTLESRHAIHREPLFRPGHSL